MRGFAVFLVGLWALSQFSVFNHYRTVDAHAAWLAEAYPDTVTYSDDRIVYKLPTVVETTTVAGSTQYRVYPDLTDMADDMHSEVLWKSSGDSVMAVTGDTGDMSPMDSATAAAVASAWGVRDPYLVELPWHSVSDPTLVALGISTAESTSIAQVVGFPYKATTYTPVEFTIAEYNDSLTNVADTFWALRASLGDSMWAANYYDRAAVLYEHFWRTGDTTRLIQADSHAVDYRDDYVFETTDEMWECPPGRWFLPEGLALHWKVRGDTLSRNGVAQLARCGTDPFSFYMERAPDSSYTPYIDGRLQTRPLLTIALAAKLAVPPRDSDGTVLTRNWDSLADAGADSIISWSTTEQAGRGPTLGRWYLKSYGYSQANFQVSHTILYSLAMYADWLDDGSRRDTIEAIVLASLDTLMTYSKMYSGSGADTANNTLPYESFDADNAADTTAASGKDLNGMFVGIFGWGFNVSGDSSYWYFADSLIDGSIDFTYWDYHSSGLGKTYNQTFWQSQKGLYWLNGGP
jgi:hypothetical protein